MWETFGAGSDAQNLARADGFKRMVEAAGQRWPDGWVKGEGFVRPPDVADPMTPPPSFDKIGEEYVRQIVDLSPGQRKRYLGQLQVLARTPVRGSLIFAGPVTAIGEAQLKTWLIEWDRSLKTKANYHGLIYGVFAYAVKRGYLAANPAIGTAPKQSRVKQSRPELRFLTERELETAVRLAKRHGDVLALAGNVLANMRSVLAREGMLKRPSWAERRTVPTDRLPEQQLHKQVSPNEELIDVLSWGEQVGLIGSGDRLLLSSLVEQTDRLGVRTSCRSGQGLMSASALAETAAEFGLSPGIVRRRARRSIDALASACRSGRFASSI